MCLEKLSTSLGVQADPLPEYFAILPYVFVCPHNNPQLA